MTDPSQLHMLLQKIRQYPVNVQQQTLELYITHELRINKSEDIKLLCQELLNKENQSPGFINVDALNDAIDYEINNADRIRQRISHKLDDMMHSYDAETQTVQETQSDVYQKLDDLDNLLTEIQQGLSSMIGKSKRNQSLSVTEMLSQIQRHKENSDQAMIDAAQTMFDRIFESINPDAAENYLDQSILQVGPLKKAALLDAAKEKYTQLLEYNQSGNFLRDYKVNYKRNLRNSNK